MQIELYTTTFGSKLYGTATKFSDTDIKKIVLPDLASLLIGRPISNTLYQTNTIAGKGNVNSDVDIEYVPIQVFARDVMKCQPYALEILYG